MNMVDWLRNNWMRTLFFFIVICSILFSINVNIKFWSLDTVGSDTYYAWVEGRRILEQKNPYARILDGNMEENNKYATYFPLFYEASAATQLLGLSYYNDWIGFWRYIFLLANILTGIMLFTALYSNQNW